MCLAKAGFAVIFLFLTSQVEAQPSPMKDHVSIYTSEFQNFDASGKGFGADLDRGGKCYDLSAQAQKAKSIDTRGSCVLLFDTPGCIGTFRKVYNHDPGANQFSKIGLSEKVKSLRLCNLKTSRSIFLFPNQDYQGTPYRLFLKSNGDCATIPVANQNQADSVKPFYSDYCFVVFTKPDCTGKGVRFRGFGNPGQNDLAEVGIKNQVKSARLCYGEDRADALFDCHKE